ncbi:MmcQ/YjbR family DNA-binding protein [Sphingomonas sp.]|uniref:MmcQ/YjbR family DNA-binding protein n=1 Tax=Sphingomonas sp. TaxID=28214 RepID=UPI0035C7CD22
MSETQIPDPLARVREIALLLPGAHEGTADGATMFLVEGQPFATIDASNRKLTLHLSDEVGQWSDIALDDATDWTLIEDRVARSWELTAPASLLEAGGR